MVARTLGLVESQERQHGRRNIAQGALFLVLLPVLVVRESKCGVLGPRHDERYLVGRMRRVRRARLEIQHLFRVAVVRSDEQRVACLLARRIDSSDRLVRMRDRLDGGVEHARMANLYRGCHSIHVSREDEGRERGDTHHVGRRKIAHDKLALGLAHDGGDFFRDVVHAHLGLQVVRRDFGRVD